jgi:nucleoside-diphosphate-sugar epimerase
MTADRTGARFLVTGATGFIGRRLVPRLVASFGADAVACLIKPPQTALERDALERFRSAGIQLIDGDLLHQPVSASPPPAVDVVFHLAANIDTDAPEDALRVNDIGTSRLLDWLAPVSRGMRVMYASSRDGYAWTILRLPTVYGPGQKADGLFDQLITRARNGAWLGRIDWPGRTSVVFVDDVADIMIKLSSARPAAGEVYCLASDDEVTVGELAQRVAIAVGRPMRPIRLPRPLVQAARAIVWSRAVQRSVPRFAWLPFWRFSLVISDGFWFDTRKFRRAYPNPLRTLDEGLAEIVHAAPESTA